MHKNLTLVGIGLAGGFLAGRFPRQTHAALTKAAQSIESRAIRRHPTPRPGTREGLGTVIEESPFPTADPMHEPDAVSDPAKDDTEGQDWSGEGGATPSGPATNVGPDEVSSASDPGRSRRF